MSVETTAMYIADLNGSWPRNKDLINEGDDHIRLIKNVLKNNFPGFDSAVNMTSSKLNDLDATFQYDSDGVITVKNELNMKGNAVKNIPDPEDAQDPVTLNYLQGGEGGSWPIGSIFFTVDSRNPKEIFGYGTWVEFAKGRCIMGSGAVSDGTDFRTFKNEDTGGSYSVTLKEENLAEHAHKIGKEVTIKEGGKHTHKVDFECGESDGSWNGSDLRSRLSSIEYTVDTREGGEHTHEIEGSVDAAGKGEAFDIIQPWIAVNIWKRVPDTE